MNRHRSLLASAEEARHLAEQSLSEVTPSRRDFSLYIATQKQELAIVARIAPGDAPEMAAMADVVRHARACDDAEVAALAVVTGAEGFSTDDMAAIAAAITAPVLRDDFIIHPAQLYHARLRGADAGVLPLADIDDNTAMALITVAQSLHMAIVVELLGGAEVERAVHLQHVILGLRCTDDAGELDVRRTCELARRLPRHRTSIALAEIHSAEEYEALQGVCDAVIVGRALRGDVGQALQVITGH